MDKGGIMRLTIFKDKKKIEYEDMMNIINNCLFDIEEIKDKIVIKNELPSIKYDSVDETNMIEESVSWFESFSFKDFS